MAFYNEDGSYAYDPCDPDYKGCVSSWVYHPLEYYCPRIFWSQESFFLDSLHSEISRLIDKEAKFNREHPDNRDALEVISHPSRPTDWHSPEFGALSTFRLCVFIRLKNSVMQDADDAGLSQQDIIDFYNNRKLE